MTKKEETAQREAAEHRAEARAEKKAEREAAAERGDFTVAGADPKDKTIAESGKIDPHDPPRGLPAEVLDPKRLPRVINQNDRAGEGESRFKVRGDVQGENSRTYYILAKEGDVKSAEECYVKACGLDKKRRVLDEKTGEVKEVVTPVDLVVKELDD